MVDIVLWSCDACLKKAQVFIFLSMGAVMTGASEDYGSYEKTWGQKQSFLTQYITGT